MADINIERVVRIDKTVKSTETDVIFNDVVRKVMAEFKGIFGTSLVEALNLLVGTRAGFPPSIRQVLGDYVAISVGVVDYFGNWEQVVYQLSHEMTHFMGFCTMGIQRPIASEEEEILCTAMALSLARKLCSEGYCEACCAVEEKADNKGYRDGVKKAKDLNFDVAKIASEVTTLFSTYKI